MQDVARSCYDRGRLYATGATILCIIVFIFVVEPDPKTNLNNNNYNSKHMISDYY